MVDILGKKSFRIYTYSELEPHEKADVEEWKNVKGTNVSWGSIDVRYSKASLPKIKNTTNLKALLTEALKSIISNIP